ncbi:MAG: PQQ-binding-like beta-propeller repeat protein, partial [Thermoplasmata archaeon]|nr:PQQ-binding-like beta-propeller repeat protein [Thermoplasmata archaeon]
MGSTGLSHSDSRGLGQLAAVGCVTLLTLLAFAAALENGDRLLRVSPSLVPVATSLAPAARVASPTAGSGDWPAYLFDGTRSARSPYAPGFGALNASTLAPRWEHHAGGFVATSATVANGRAFVGAWDGYEYALNATTGQLLWRTYLNTTTTANCLTTRGISSTPTVVGGTAYLGGGGDDWYALNTSTGSILWKVFVGNNSTTGGHYNWASPLIYDGFGYIGVASDCDTPLVQGGLLQVNLTTHLIAHVFNTSTKLAHGASVWGSPTVDPALNLVYIATGNGGQYGSSVVALNASTLALNGSWQVPTNQSISDGDFGNTPTIFTDTSGHGYVGVANKNGLFYAFRAADISAGPVWELPVAVPGDCPECGQGSISPAAFDGTNLYVAGGQTTIDGTNYSGSVRALSPATGAILWQHGAPGAILAGLAVAGGFVFDAAGRDLEVLNATTGAPLLSYPADAALFAAPSVAEGLVFVSSAAGTTYALAPSTGHWLDAFVPPGSMNASMAYDAADRSVVQFGGCATDLCPSPETWTWAGGMWTNATPEFLNASNSPSERLDAGMAYDASDGYVVLFGGYSAAGGD